VGATFALVDRKAAVAVAAGVVAAVVGGAAEVVAAVVGGAATVVVAEAAAVGLGARGSSNRRRSTLGLCLLTDR
jgi:hypothetical protein